MRSIQVGVRLADRTVRKRLGHVQQIPVRDRDLSETMFNPIPRIGHG